MKIGIIGSMQFVEKMLETAERLKDLGHEAVISPLYYNLVGKNDEEKEKTKLDNKYNRDAIRGFWKEMQGADAVLVLNYDKNGVKNYIGANTFLEIGFAHILGQKIFILNPLPEFEFYRTELEAMRPIIINGDLNKIM